ncbi:MAG: hypothetical protein H0U79_08380 [Solirubrobacterales bacterium]|nr:hypothetical protein [Solirubrobacterales bacterium]
MHVPAVTLEHPEVRVIQPTWHCLLRFRQRWRPAVGTDAAVQALVDALREADIGSSPPAWAAGESASRWATVGPCAFPLMPSGASGTWTATTCLLGPVRRSPRSRAR